MKMSNVPPTLLCIANFPGGTGYAWDFFESLYAAVADELAASGVRTVVAFPKLNDVSGRLQNSTAELVELDRSLESIGSALTLVRFLRRENVRVLYLIDHPAWHPYYALLRLSRVRRIIVYDQSSGSRTRPTGVKRIAKKVRQGIWGTMADRVLTVSDYVARRHRDVGLVPADRIQTVWNSIAIPDVAVGPREELGEMLGLPADRIAFACACRATPQKGVQFLLQAFERVWKKRELANTELVLIYVGDGPYMRNLERLRDSLSSKNDIVFTGYRTDAREIIAQIDVAVVPSVWEEAFGLSALEPMACGKPVIATSVGGIPEIVVHRSTGLLVPPRDVDSLAAALEWMITHRDEAREMGARGRTRAQQRFSPEDQLSRIVTEIRDGFA